MKIDTLFLFVQLGKVDTTRILHDEGYFNGFLVLQRVAFNRLSFQRFIYLLTIEICGHVKQKLKTKDNHELFIRFSIVNCVTVILFHSMRLAVLNYSSWTLIEG